MIGVQNLSGGSQARGTRKTAPPPAANDLEKITKIQSNSWPTSNFQ